jgi:hypothetical protein
MLHNVLIERRDGRVILYFGHEAVSARRALPG